MDIVFWQLSFTLPPCDDDHTWGGYENSDIQESLIITIWLSGAACRLTLMTFNFVST